MINSDRLYEDNTLNDSLNLRRKETFLSKFSNMDKLKNNSKPTIKIKMEIILSVVNEKGILSGNSIKTRADIPIISVVIS